MSIKKLSDVCPLCERKIPDKCGNRHHLVPKLKGGTLCPTEMMHVICHSKLHSIFTEGELARDYNTVDKLLENEEIAKFVKWVQKRPDSFSDHNKQHSRKR